MRSSAVKADTSRVFHGIDDGLNPSTFARSYISASLGVSNFHPSGKIFGCGTTGASIKPASGIESPRINSSIEGTFAFASRLFSLLADAPIFIDLQKSVAAIKSTVWLINRSSARSCQGQGRLSGALELM